VKDIKAILTTEPTPASMVPFTTRDSYISEPGINPSSLASGLVGFSDVNPLAIKKAWEAPDRIERTAASQDSLDRGTVAHLMVLQPELLLDRVAVWRGGRRGTNEYVDFQEQNAGKILLTSSDWNRVATATNAMRSLPEVAGLVNGCEFEVALFGDYKCQAAVGHMRLKGQVDGINVASRTIIDIKTTEAGIDERSVTNTIRNMRYREKMAMYRMLAAKATGIDAVAWKCVNIFMSLKEPYGVVVVQFTRDALEWGELRMMSAIQSVDGCLASNVWPIYCREMFGGVEPWESEDNDEEIDYAS